MIDVNVLVYAVDSNQPRHEAAKGWLDEQLNGRGRTIGLPWETLVGFMRILTNPRIFRTPLTAEQAWDQVDQWLSSPASWVPVPGPGHRNILDRIMRAERPTAKLIPDAHLVALAIEYGLTVASADTDFGGFADVRWIDPTRTR
ncbi:PIN domain-containing protein [Glycomyces sp. A-F 0318]|uniref:TA system VapC family ribonuclease toxin n=1 Tax=Glycomyces amatae TaxID=2881355 RepID=UPI001E28D54C|nr:TA system VapC family ribonuclease toxin [Glycomyces amatae]MCD0444476.1 PIN domain-containing protein [Glycomyces amatae]